MNLGRLIKASMVLLGCTIALSGCGSTTQKTETKKANVSTEITDSSIVMSIGSDNVKYREVEAYAYFLSSKYNTAFGSNIWDYSVGSNKTIGDEAKQEIVNLITQLKIITQTAKSQNVTLSTDEIDEATQKAEEFMKTVSKKDKKKYNLGLQEIENIFEENSLADKMFYITTDAADTDVTDEEARQALIQYVEIVTNGIDKDNKTISMTDEQKADAKTEADNLYNEAVKTDDFLSFARKYTTAATVEAVVGNDSTDIDKTVLSTAMQMSSGDVSQVIEGQDGYYIIYCTNENDETSTYNKKEQIIEERQEKLFTTEYSKWMKDCEVSISEKFWNSFNI